jgi:hypothetical protein
MESWKNMTQTLACSLHAVAMLERGETIHG